MQLFFSRLKNLAGLRRHSKDALFVNAAAAKMEGTEPRQRLSGCTLAPGVPAPRKTATSTGTPQTEKRERE